MPGTTRPRGRSPARATGSGGLPSALHVVVVALAFHAAWIGCYFALGHEARDFIKIGYRYVQRSDASQVIRFDPSYRYPANRDAPNGKGYDGQFSYYMALDFSNARHYMDLPALRYSRVLYPVVARGLAAGKPSAIPYTLLLVNWLAVGLGVASLAVWLQRRRCSPWLALAYGLYPGLLLSVQRDLTEPLAYGLVALAVLLLDLGGRGRVVWAGLAFGLAALARQTTLVFPLCYALALLTYPDPSGWRPRLRAHGSSAAVLMGVALAPFAVYTAVLVSWLGWPSESGNIAPAPFLGLVTSHPWSLARQPPVVITVVLPALIAAGVALRTLRAAAGRAELYALVGNVLLLVVLLGHYPYSGGYTSVGRIATGVVLAGVLSAPFVWRAGATSRRWMAAAAALSLSMLPVITVYGLGDFRV